MTQRVNEIDEFLLAEEQKRQADIEAVMQTAEGQRIVHWILKEGRIFQPCFTGNSKTFYNLGARELALRLFVLVTRACPDLFYESHKRVLRKEKQYAERQRARQRRSE